MKKIVILLFVFLASIELNGQYLLGILNYNAFSTAKMESFIEFQFMIDGKTTRYVLNENHKYFSEVEIIVNINQKKSALQKDSLIETIHYILMSEEFEDSIQKTKPYFMDIQNVKVPNGDYELSFYIKDVHDTTKVIKYIDFLQVHFPKDKIGLSGLSLWQTFNATGEGGIYDKYGYSVTPLFNNFAPESVYALPITLEIYNAQKIFGDDADFLVRASIVPADLFIRGDKEYVEYRKMKSKEVIVFLHQFNIFGLSSGNYNVVVEILDIDSNVMGKASAFLQRSNPSVKLDLKNYDNVIIDSTFVEKITDMKVMQEYVASLYPIGTVTAQEFFYQRMKNVPIERLQKFFYSFWAKRSPTDPQGAWEAYHKKVQYVQAHYGSPVIQGFRTDRGRVYLKYGERTSVTEVPFDPQSYPYEIWHYYVIGEQTNVKFIFYNRDLISNNYELLHSDMIGETYDPAWQMRLVKRLDPSANPDVTKPNDYWGGEADDQYRYNK